MRRTYCEPARFSWTALLIAILTSGVWAAGARLALNPPNSPSASAPNPSAGTGGARRDFAPGVRIDWNGKTVEVDGRVVLREGPLELLACSPQTKEHESIVVVAARPLHIFQAMGLVGLEAGSPPRFDEKLGRWLPAFGESLDIRVRFRAADQEKIVDAGAWMLERGSGKAPKLPWVFTGSRVREGEDGRFAADADGNVVSVVDFDTALISLAAGHSADNEELWLAANPDAIPPKGTPCTLLVRSAFQPKIEVEVGAGGIIRQEDKVVTPRHVVEQLLSGRDDRTPKVIVRRSAGCSAEEFSRIVGQLQDEMKIRSLDADASLELSKGPGAPRRDLETPKARE